MDYYYENNNVYIKNPECFDLKMTLDCGQAFRWQEIKDGVFEGVANDRFLRIEQNESEIILKDTSKNDFENFWYDYFDLKRDYKKIIEEISGNKILKDASNYGKGIRILNQDPFEALCSFIISQNNNIPRIKGIIMRLSEKFGEKIKDNYYSFPKADVLSRLNEDDLSDIRMGFRTKYILDASKKVANGEIVLEKLFDLDYETAQEELMKIKGVGPKVADCTLLFSLKHFSAFPKDVWIKRAMELLFPNGLPKAYEKYGGIIQQYIFYYARGGNLDIKKE